MYQSQPVDGDAGRHSPGLYFLWGPTDISQLEPKLKLPSAIVVLIMIATPQQPSGDFEKTRFVTHRSGGYPELLRLHSKVSQRELRPGALPLLG